MGSSDIQCGGYFFPSGFQFFSSVIGVAALSTRMLIRNRRRSESLLPLD
jgi:hypothetical protein